jgi:hypothetical protein
LRDKARLDHEFQNAVIKKLTNKAGSADKEQRENLKAEIDSLVKELPLIPTIPRLYTDDCTPEHLGTLMQENNEALAWLSSEGNLFDILAGQYSSGNANIDIFLKSHAGEDVNVDRGSREPVRLYEPKLTIGLCPQPDLLTGTIAKNRKILNSGLLFRFLYFWPQSTLGSRTRHTRPVAQQITDNYLANLPTYLEEVKTLQHCNDWEALRSIAHSIKGSSGCFNFDEIYHSAAALEENLKSNNKVPRDELVNKLIAAIEQAISGKVT